MNKKLTYEELEQMVKKLNEQSMKRKRAEEALRKSHNQLKTWVERHTRELQDANTALAALLKQRDQDKTDLEKNVLLNVRKHVTPYIEKLKKSRLGTKQRAYLNVLESNLKDLISPFTHKLSSNYFNLTPTELQIARLVKDGKTTRQIAELLNSSSRTIESHRQNIRAKVGISRKKANLRSHLLSM